MSQIKEFYLHPIREQFLDLPLGATVLEAKTVMSNGAYMIRLAVVVNPMAMTEQVRFMMFKPEEDFSGVMVNKFIGHTEYGYLFQMIM